MIQNLAPQKIYSFITNDFEHAWKSLASTRSAGGRGNFMFGLQAMILLEFAARLCYSDKTGKALKDLSGKLFEIEPKYSTPMPGVCAHFRDYDLPCRSESSKGKELLWAIFDLVRNGEAHQYQQIVVNLADGADWAITLTGAEFDRHLQSAPASRPVDHLSYCRDQNRDLWLRVYPDFLFVDVKDAIEKSRLLQRNLNFNHLARPLRRSQRLPSGGRGPFYCFTSKDLEKALSSGGHSRHDCT